MEIGQILRARRLELNLSIRKVSRLAGIADRTIFYIENGKSQPTFNVLGSLCKSLDLEIKIEKKEVCSEQ